jgi:4-hydroxybenzoyl-CoA thioesterase
LFIHKLNVRFDDVDYARIVYYPRLFAYCHWVFEEFFAKEVGCTYAEMLKGRKVGFPTVHAQADFQNPLSFGDVARVQMETLKLGEKSITNQYRLFLGDSDTLCAMVEVITVSIDMGTFKPVPMPDDVRAVFQKHLRPQT